MILFNSSIPSVSITASNLLLRMLHTPLVTGPKGDKVLFKLKELEF